VHVIQQVLLSLQGEDGCGGAVAAKLGCIGSGVATGTVSADVFASFCQGYHRFWAQGVSGSGGSRGAAAAKLGSSSSSTASGVYGVLRIGYYHEKMEGEWNCRCIVLYLLSFPSCMFTF
jgi:hypothetical protein